MLTPRRRAISLLVRPCWTAWTTRHSAGVSTSLCGGRPLRFVGGMGAIVVALVANFPPLFLLITALVSYAEFSCGWPMLVEASIPGLHAAHRMKQHSKTIKARQRNSTKRAPKDREYARALTYSDFVQTIARTHSHFATRRSLAINVGLTLRNWTVGCHIQESNSAPSTAPDCSRT